MLVLSRRINEKLLFPTVPAVVQVVGIRAGVVRLGIEAPPEVAVLREELKTAPPPRPPDGPQRGAAEQVQAAAANVALLRRQLRADLRPEAAETLGRLDRDLRELERTLWQAESSPAGRPGPRALLVEDNANERELLARYLRDAGLEVSTAGDGVEALDFLRTNSRPDVVLLDMGLPRCDGVTAVRTIRSDPRLADLPIFAVTGHAREEFDLETGPRGIDRWFQKPLDPGELIRNLTGAFLGGQASDPPV